jgi:hypothetical protein
VPVAMPAPESRATTDKEVASTSIGQDPAQKSPAALSERGYGVKAALPSKQTAAPLNSTATRPDLARKSSGPVRAAPLVAGPRAPLAGARAPLKATAVLAPAAGAPRAPAGQAALARPSAVQLDKENRPDKLAVMKRKLDEFRAKKLSDATRPAPSLGLAARPNGGAAAGVGPRPPLATERAPGRQSA